MEKEGKIYEDATWGNIGKDIVPSRFYRAFRVEGPWNSDDESLWYDFNSEEKSEIVIDPELSNIVANVWGKAENFSTLSVTVTPNETLKGEYPLAQVKINEKFYDLGVLDNPLSLYMDKDYRISIIWSPELVETFRVIRLF